MDFNTGSGESGEERDQGLHEERTAGSGGEFDYRDPVQSFIGTVQSIVTSPVSFFSGMARQGDFLNPLIFAVICAEVSAIISGVLSVLGAIVGIGEFGGALGSLILGIVLAPIFLTIGLLIWTGILHLLVMLIVKPLDTGFETTFRAGAYASMPQLVGWVPLIGWLIAGVWTVVLAVLGIREAHSTSTGKAAAVVLIPAAVLALIGIVLVIIIGAFIFAFLSGAGGQ